MIYCSGMFCDKVARCSKYFKNAVETQFETTDYSCNSTVVKDSVSGKTRTVYVCGRNGKHKLFDPYIHRDENELRQSLKCLNIELDDPETGNRKSIDKLLAEIINVIDTALLYSTR